MTLGEATRQYQDALEAYRTDATEDTARTLLQAYNLMEHLWLEDSWQKSGRVEPAVSEPETLWEQWLGVPLLMRLGIYFVTALIFWAYLDAFGVL